MSPDHELLNRSIAAFRTAYGHRPACQSFAPGRVEILGNHTDYNGGHVLSVALELGVSICSAPISAGSHMELWSEEFDEEVHLDLDSISKVEGSWSNYQRGVVLELLRAGVPVAGTRMSVSSNLPVGAGVSSSAALELATAEVLYQLYGGRPEDRMEEAKLCQRAESSFVGVPCGLLDQFSSAFGRPNCFLVLDCDTLEHEQVEARGTELRVVVADSGVKHALVDGQYASLRASCQRSARRLGELLDHPVRFLRDVSPRELAGQSHKLAPEDRARAEHVVSENDRVLEGIRAIRACDFAALGELMFASHASSRDLFGNSTAELDFLVAAARDIPGCLGAKLTGGGFGGSTVNLIEKDRAEEFGKTLAEAYRSEMGRELRTLVSGIGGGARAWALPADENVE